MKYFFGAVSFTAIAVFIIGIVVLLRVLFSGSIGLVKTKTKCSPATVKGKYKVDKMRSCGVYTIYFMRFELSKDDTIELPVSKKIFKKAPPGTTGMLYYKGSYFVDFVIDEEAKETKNEEAQEASTYILNGEVVKK